MENACDVVYFFGMQVGMMREQACRQSVNGERKHRNHPSSARQQVVRI
jgi:hypothetical protein